MKSYQSLIYRQQLALLKNRGVKNISLIKNTDTYLSQVKTLEIIGYYNLKNLAEPFFDDFNQSYNVSFSYLEKRYFQDQRIRLSILKIIEDIEVTLNTQISHVLGKYENGTGYLNFTSWVSPDIHNDPISGLRFNPISAEREQKRRIINGIRKSSFVEIKKLKSEWIESGISEDEKNLRRNFIYDKQQLSNQEKTNLKNDFPYPPIWIAISLFDFGNSKYLFNLMNSSDKKLVHDFFGISSARDFSKYLDTINLARNLCCHNENLIDIEIRQKPPVPNEYKDILYSFKKNNKTSYTNKIALIIVIVVLLTKHINHKFEFREIRHALKKITTDFNKLPNDRLAQRLGFKDIPSMYSLFPY